MREIKVGNIYKHFKDKYYIVIDIVNDNKKLHNIYNSSDALIEEITNKTKLNLREESNIKFIPINEVLPYLESGGYDSKIEIEKLTNDIINKITSAIR